MQACNEALSLATDLHISSICIASDYAEVVSNIHASFPYPYTTVLREINQHKESFRALKIIHGRAEQNGEAHLAASFFATGHHVWLSVFIDIICIPMNIVT